MPDADLAKEQEDSDGTTSEDEAAERHRQRTLARRRGQRLRHHLSEIMDGEASDMSFLERQSITKRVRNYYEKELDLFMAYVKEQGLDVATDTVMDNGLVQYFNKMYVMGEQGHRGEKLLAAVLDRWPRFGRLGDRKIPRAWRALRGWKRLTPGRSREPKMLGVWCAMAVEFIKADLLQMAVFTLLCLSAYLRPSEGFSIRRGDLHAPMTGANSHWTLVLHPEARGEPGKTGEFDDSVVFDSSWTRPWLPQMLEILTRGQKSQGLWSFDYPTYLAAFKRCRVKINEPELIPYQLRHSGPSIDRSRGWRDIMEVQKRGRWRTFKSVARYEKHGRLSGSAQRHGVEMRAYFNLCEHQLEAMLLGRRVELGEPPLRR